MKKLLPALILVLLSIAACKKDNNTPPEEKPGTGAAAVTLGSLSVSMVTEGMSVTLSGSNLPAATSEVKVTFNGVDAPVQYSSGTALIVTVPVTTSGSVKAVIGGKTISGPSFIYVSIPKITAISPTVVSEGSVVTITGTGLQASGLTTVVSFSGIPGTIDSATPTELKVIVPKAASGKVTVTLAPQIFGLSAPYTYVSPGLLAPYSNGSVILTSQAEVDAFVDMNKGKQLQVTGDLEISGGDINSVAGLSIITSISGKVSFRNVEGLADAPFLSTLSKAGELSFVYAGLTSLNLNNLQGFTGGIYVNNMAKLSSVNFSGLTAPSYISLNYTPLLTDLGFLSNITSTGSISLTNTGARMLRADNLTTIRSVDISGCAALTSVSMRSLITTTGNYSSGITISQCPALTTVDFSALTTVAGKLSLSGTAITGMDGFSALTGTGSLSLSGNSELQNLQGLKNLKTITSPAITSGALAGSVVFNGVNILLNPKLTSLDGLQNVTTLPLLTIRDNVSLNDICPLKEQINKLNAIPAYTYKYTPCCDFGIGYFKTGSRAALILTGNGSYATQQEALDAVELCK
ncbi:IPT/TIG domain-containing protein [Mucilaginibacter pedocola]|uniref:IPT/TIG domain-containing protein n=1 Tax=Mucilaginibacter pedocola TaxID=1792845 RepID=A0A1S9PKP5_9SPHI|nr:IPT/TIG domain-containing protein [Mucilaginibacter pedocola]OOQ61521.1 hypothetical protein BC343_00110 [Mucilaginibacter pedocola]